jgi:hypothetical protein
MLADVLTDSDNSTLDDLLAGFELPDQQNPETFQQIVNYSSKKLLKTILIIFFVL